MSIPTALRNPRLLAVLALAVIAVVLIAPNAVRSALPSLLFLVCPVMMLLMMVPMHRMGSHEPRRDQDDPYDPEALRRRLAELEAERAGIERLLAATPPPADATATPNARADARFAAVDGMRA